MIEVVKNLFVNEQGEVWKRVSDRKIVKANISRSGRGYPAVCANGSVYYVHRLIATAFIKNPGDLPTVNHKDGNKKNNGVDNLEWCSYGDNNLHAYRVLGKKPRWEHALKKSNEAKRKAVACTDLNGNNRQVFVSMAEASRITSSKIQSICDCCKGRMKSTNGYVWSYA